MKLSEMKSLFDNAEVWMNENENQNNLGRYLKKNNSMKLSKFPSNVPDAASTISHKFPTFNPMSLKN